jgi:hypothetical protein
MEIKMRPKKLLLIKKMNQFHISSLNVFSCKCCTGLPSDGQLNLAQRIDIICKPVFCTVSYPRGHIPFPMESGVSLPSHRCLPKPGLRGGCCLLKHCRGGAEPRVHGLPHPEGHGGVQLGGGLHGGGGPQCV